MLPSSMKLSPELEALQRLLMLRTPDAGALSKVSSLSLMHVISERLGTCICNFATASAAADEVAACWTAAALPPAEDP